MKLAFSTTAFVRNSLNDALAAIATIGYAGVEIMADTPHLYPATFDEAQVDRIRRLLDHLGLSVACLNANRTMGYWANRSPEPVAEPSLISPDPKYRADRVAFIQNTLRYAKALSAECISITTGRCLPTMPPDLATKTLRENLLPVLDLAEKLKVHIGIECEPAYLIESAAELRELIDRMGSAMLGANFDVGHALITGDNLAQSLERLENRIWNCHVEDMPGKKHYHLIPGQGTLDWQKIKTALADAKYNRWLTVDLPTYPDRPVEAAQETYAYLTAVF